MYKNTGSKIIAMANGLTTALFVISIIFGVMIGQLIGTVMYSSGAGFFAGFIFSGIGVVLAWISNLLLAGFGELMSNTHELLLIVRKASSESFINVDNGNMGTHEHGKSVPPNHTDGSIHPLVRRAFLFLEDGEWDKAEELLEQVLNSEPESAKAYVGKLCVELHLNREDDLLSYKLPLDELSNYKKALRFADTEYRTKLTSYAITPEERHKQEEVAKETTELNTLRKMAFYADDRAKILSEETKRRIVILNENLETLCSGAQIVVVTSETHNFTSSIEEATNLFNSLGVGDKDENNGMLLLFYPEKTLGSLMVGDGISYYWTTENINDCLDRFFWPYVDAGDHDRAVNTLLDHLLEWFTNYYGVQMAI